MVFRHISNDFSETTDYCIYSETGLTEAKIDFDDGGFRGWSIIIPVEMVSQKCYFRLTFDRHNGSNYNWSYGDIDCFESI